jgi:hypothetical protein
LQARESEDTPSSSHPVSKTCEKCGKVLADGSLAYEVRIQVCADFDGLLPELETTEDPAERLRALAARLSDAEPADLMRDVCHTEQHLLCPGCRDHYLANPLNLPLPESPA